MSDFEPKMLVFCCENSSFLIANKIPRNEIPNKVTVVKVPCCGQVGTNEMLSALQNGADGLLMMPCMDENCKHLRGNIRANKRVDYLSTVFDEAGISSERIKIVPIAANNEFSYREAVNTIYEHLRNLGPIEGKVSK